MATFIYKDGDSKQDIIITIDNVKRIDENSPWIGMDFSIDVKRPPHSREWSCSMTFNGKAKDAPLNADMCLFLEEWESQREQLRSYGLSQTGYRKWKDKTITYYTASPVDCDEPEDLPRAEQIKRRNAYLESLYAKQDENE